MNSLRKQNEELQANLDSAKINGGQSKENSQLMEKLMKEIQEEKQQNTLQSFELKQLKITYQENLEQLQKQKDKISDLLNKNSTLRKENEIL